MRTVKEISELTGISVRTLHYYDEIGLLKPTAVNEAGYRFYDEKALETLQQILYFREFDMPLKDIKIIMENPELDKNKMLESQKQMLELKKERLERLIASIDDILKGENKMDFEVFSKDEIEALYQTTIANMPQQMKDALLEEYGELEKYHDHYMELASGEHAQKNYRKMVEWYGDKESALEAAKHPVGEDVIKSYQQRTKTIIEKLVQKKEEAVDSFEVKSIIGEYGFVIRQLYQMKDETQMMLEIGRMYETDERIKNAMDEEYGKGTAELFANAVEAFYNRK